MNLKKVFYLGMQVVFFLHLSDFDIIRPILEVRCTGFFVTELCDVYGVPRGRRRNFSIFVHIKKIEIK